MRLLYRPEAGQRCGAYGSGMQGEKIPEPYYEIRPGGVAIVFRFEDINNESNSNQNCELDCKSKLTDRQNVILSILMSDGEKTASWIASQLEVGFMLVEVLHLLKLTIGLFLMETIVVVFILQTFKTLRKMRFDFKMPAPTNEKLRKSLEFTNRVLQNDRLMHEYILVPCFDRKQYNSLLKEDLTEGATCIAGHHHIRYPGAQCHTRAT